MAYLKVTKEIPGSPWKVGDVQSDLPEQLVRSFVSSGFGEEVKADEWMRASQASSWEQFRAQIMKDLDDKLSALSKGNSRALPPHGGGHVNFSKVAAGHDPVESENKRAAKQDGFHEAIRCLAIASAPQIYHPDRVMHMTRRLNEMSEYATEYKYDPTTDSLTETTTRTLADGGMETVVRTGTDSMSGGATYGFSLKPLYLTQLYEISMEQQVFANAAERMPVDSGNEIKRPAWDQYQTPTTVNGIQQSAVFAGISLGYAGETAIRPSSDALLNMITWKIVDLTGYTTLSRDLVADNYLGIDSQVTRMFGRAIGWMEDYMSIQGTGNGKPQGFQNSGATLVVNRASGSKIRPVDLTTMISNTSPMVHNRLRWITNITTYPQLSILYDGTNYVFQPNALISQAMQLSVLDLKMGGAGAELLHRPMGVLLGIPVYFSEKVQTLGNTGDLNLVAPSEFGIAERSGLEVAVSEHFLFSTDEIALRFKKRHDMKSFWRAPYQQADGSNTKVAPFVMLH